MEAPANTQSSSHRKRDRRASPTSPSQETCTHHGGNQAVQAAFQWRTIQAKLAVGGVDDPLEREADQVALTLDGDCACGGSCAECQARGPLTIQRKVTRGGNHQRMAVSPHVVRGLGAGRSLDSATGRFFGSRLSHDFSRTRIHTGGRADESASTLGARAFTYGTDIVFARGEYAPHTREGRRLLAHELTHVVQQNQRTQQSNVVQRETGERAEEIERSRTSPGRFTGTYPPISFSLYNFAIQESALKPDHAELLNDLASWLVEHPEFTVAVAGHTDNTGPDEINAPLSRDRASSVVDHLSSHGVFASATSFGSARPVMSNASERGRNRNRRVDIIVFVPASIPSAEGPSSEGETAPPETTGPPPEEEDDFSLFCVEHPFICAAVGVGVFCLVFPEICALPLWPEWPQWPEEEEETEEPESLNCGDPRLPLTQVRYIPPSGDKGIAVEAKPLTRCPGNTTGSAAKNNDPDWPHGWQCVAGADETDLWVRAHLLHHGLHGPGDSRRNIIISDKSINGLMYTRIERHAVARAWDHYKTLWYRVQVQHFDGDYPRPYFAESVHMEWGEMDPETGVETTTESDQTIESNVGRQPPPCASEPDTPVGPEQEEATTPTEEPVHGGHPTIGPADPNLVILPTPVHADCGRISCRTLDHYRETVGHFRDETYILSADEVIVREMIRREREFLRATRFSQRYRLLELDRIRGRPGEYLAHRALLETEVETEARRRVFDFLINRSGDSTWALTGSVEDYVQGNYARGR